MANRRRWFFRIIVAVLTPLIVVGGLEASLRLFGYGYPTSFFLRAKINGRNYYVPNDRFGYRFFPPTIARAPVTLAMPAEKPAGAYRIFLFGESAAQGDPDPSYGAGRYLQALLRERFPGTDFEVICVAMTAINSHAILPIARECAHHDGDLWIIYMGNNEMVGPFGASTVFGAPAPPIPLVRAELAIKSTRLGQLLDSLVQHLHKAPATPKIWGGLTMFKDHQLRQDDPSRLRACDNFAANLADILKAGRSAGVPIILSTVGSNLKDCAPFASLHAAALNPSQEANWNSLCQQGTNLQATGDFQNALQRFAQAETIDPDYADLHFRIATCDLALKNAAPAAHEFELARDDDALAFRADDRINQIIKDAASQQNGKGIYLLDAASILAQHSPQNIPGNELFYEHVHLNFEGNYLLGRAFAEQTTRLLPEPIAAKGKKDWASGDVCDARLAVTPWDRFRLWQDSLSRISEPPFSDQLNQPARLDFYAAKLQALSSQMNNMPPARARAIYTDALARSPGDPDLIGNFAQFLAQNGDVAEAVKQEELLCQLLPQSPTPPSKAGVFLVQLGNTAEAEKYFAQALDVHPDYVPALNEMGVLLANQQKTDAAVSYLNRSIRINPGFPDAYLDLGFIEHNEGKLDQATDHYRQAAELQPGGPDTYYFQGVANSEGGAVQDYQIAIAMNPAFWQARYRLGMELVSLGQIDDAQAQFAQVVRLRPDFSDAHFVYAVCLARHGQLTDAQKEFQLTLKYNPTNTVAQQNLAVVQANLQSQKNQ